MSIFSDEIEPSKLPQSSRFFNQTTLPDLRTFLLTKNNKPLAFNGQHSNITYNPYNFPQLKTKANFPLDFFHLPNKIHLTGLPNSENPEPESIPSYKLDDNQAKDPIRFFESVAEEARNYGAIKVKIPVVQDNLLRSNFQINSDLFWFQSNKLLNNSHQDELKNRLQFHSELIRFHMSDEKEPDQQSTQDEQITRDATTDIPTDSQCEKESTESVQIPDLNASVSEKSFNGSEILLSNVPVIDGVETPDAPLHDLTKSSLAAAESALNNTDAADPNVQLSVATNGDELQTAGIEIADSQATEADQTEKNVPNVSFLLDRNTSINSLLNSPSVQPSDSQETTAESTQPLTAPSHPENSSGLKTIKSESSSELDSATPLGSNQNLNLDSPNLLKESKKLSKKKQIPSFLMKLPMIDKRPIDLYKLFRSVVIRGGFVEVINKKLWAQIGRELGYKGKIMTSLSSSLKSSYQRILYPFEVQLGQRKFGLAGLDTPDQGNEEDRNPAHTVKVEDEVDYKEEPNINGKREINQMSTESRKRRNPLILGSGIEFQRSVQLKGSKGFLVNTPHLIDIKPPISFTIKDEDNISTKKGKKGQEITESPILPQNQLNHSLSNMLNSPSNSYQDESGLKAVPKIASIYSMRQFMEKDLKFQEFIVQHNASSFNKMSANFPSFYHFNEPNMPIPERNFIKFDKYEELYWKFVLNEDSNHPLLKDGLELEHGENLLSLIHGSGFVKIGDDLMNYKNNLNNLNINASSNKIINTANNKIINTFVPNTNTQVSSNSYPTGSNPISSTTTPANDVDLFNTDYYISNILQSAMNPWNLHNLPVLPNSLFGALSENDINNQDLTNSRINIGMTFSTQNWKCEDHFTQLINYHFFGAFKKWYFIPELEFEKFEALILEVNESNKDRVSINNDNWAIEELLELIGNNEGSEIRGLEYDTLVNSLENMINPFQDERLPHSNVEFQKLISANSKKIRFNQDFLITPQMLRERGIKYSTTIQKPGEFVVKSSKTYSLALSFGLNFSEEVNFATQTWLPYATEAEQWLAKQSILPNFLTFKLLVNLIQLYDSGKSIGFNSLIYSKVGSFYEEMYRNELEIRFKIRKLKIKEMIIDSENTCDSISDDNFVNAFPSKIVLTDRSTSQSFILAPSTFIKLHDEKIIPFEKFKIEFHLFYSDDKLRNFSRILNGYSIDYEQWTQKYEELMTENTDLALKVYKGLLNDGERIYSAISSANFLIGGSSEEDKKRINELNKFKNHIENLKLFIEDSNKFIDECQNLLAIKHHQRIRSGNEFQSSKGLEDLVKLVDRIPTLNFSCIEIDQILEFKSEIENFDKASRMLLSKKNRSLKEFDDLIDLGESFGIEIPSLKFLIRIRDRLKWLSRFNLIEKGDDPFSDKKEIFTLQHLQDFFDTGLKVLSEVDLPKIIELEKILKSSLNFNKELDRFLQYESADQLNLDQLQKFVAKFQGERLFLGLETYNELSKVHLNSKLITQYIEFKEQKYSKYSYSDLRTLQSSLVENEIRFNPQEIVHKLYSTEQWVYRLWEEVRNKKVVTTLSKEMDLKHLNPKFTLEGRLIEKFYQFLYKNEFNFAVEDTHEISSAYLMKFVDPESEIAPTYYCNCREYEFGTMIECDKCNEWYHIVCVNEGEEHQGNDDESYTCPVCQLIESNSTTDEYLRGKVTWNRVKEMVDEGRGLKVYPANELNSLEEVYLGFTKHYEDVRKKIEEAKRDPRSSELRLDLFKFFLRKLYGSGILFQDLLEEVVNLVREEERKIAMQQPVPQPADVEVPLHEVNGNHMALSSSIDKQQITTGQTVIGVQDATAPIDRTSAEPPISAPQLPNDIQQTPASVLEAQSVLPIRNTDPSVSASPDQPGQSQQVQIELDVTEPAVDPALATSGTMQGQSQSAVVLPPVVLPARAEPAVFPASDLPPLESTIDQLIQATHSPVDNLNQSTSESGQN
ncbi:PLU-1-domain-containing protein [Suhomyces tanzawaensis NRRL Y-17324]|uniref:PLU-1-domain-containing protein n=1 Tax=Suhomyces tanzawaensis NRRL Y-17324 TaxID=984487 RepID=A0A1E4SPG4_9ASCO|nr:PLU-1-domain-containing protein [Suhomyces tanzawaensis NRRL Y-17324]ODV81414.1 PLU-1-domain-containing protein [Suhomyces tanzawaensis NRRL Y-17324]